MNSAPHLLDRKIGRETIRTVVAQIAHMANHLRMTGSNFDDTLVFERALHGLGVLAWATMILAYVGVFISELRPAHRGLHGHVALQSAEVTDGNHALHGGPGGQKLPPKMPGRQNDSSPSHAIVGQVKPADDKENTNRPRAAIPPRQLWQTYKSQDLPRQVGREKCSENGQ